MNSGAIELCCPKKENLHQSCNYWLQTTAKHLRVPASLDVRLVVALHAATTVHSDFLATEILTSPLLYTLCVCPCIIFCTSRGIICSSEL